MIWLAPRASAPVVWAIEDDAVQICWGDLPAGPVRARATDDGDASRVTAEAAVDHEGGPGAIDLAGLTPGRSLTIDLGWADGSTTLRATTLVPPPGELLARFATISDLHLGSRTWGAMRTMTDDSGHPVPHPYRCAAAAVREAEAWGAELLIIKGDAVEHECQEDFDALGDLVDTFPELDMILLPGNHEVDGRPGGIPDSVGRRELPYVRTVEHWDRPGLRIVAADTTILRRGVGTLERVGAGIEERVAGSRSPVFLAIHHQLQRHRLPRYWPAGIPAPESTRLLDQLDRLDQPVIVSSGHTHRNRSRRHGSTLVTEVASTKDWPGVWAGYAVHEGGIRQVIRRAAAPEAITWTEYSRLALRGLWSRWSPGPIDQRCISNVWAPDRSHA